MRAFKHQTLESLMSQISVRVAIALLSVASLASVCQAQTSGNQPVGTMRCAVKSNGDTPIIAKEQVVCDFFSAVDGTATRYDGRITDVDIDAAEVDDGHMTWLVIGGTPTADFAGVYSASPAGPELNMPGHAIVLKKTDGSGVILRPYLLQGHGLNFAVGVKGLSLVNG
jgi:hypothetical protein